MNTAAPAPSEADRLALLAATRLLDAEPPPALDALVRLAAARISCPAALLNLVDAHRLFALARHGSHRRHFSREGSCCDRVVQSGMALIVHDMAKDPLHAGHFQDAQEASWLSYAGVPVVVEGRTLGTVCVFDTRQQAFDELTLGILTDLAQIAQSIISAQLAAHRARLQEARFRTASLGASDWMWETDDQGHIQWVSAGLQPQTGLDPIAEIGLKAKDIYQPRDDETRESWDRFILARERREPFSDAIAERDTPRGRIAVSISGTPVFNSQGRFMGYRGSSRNVTRQLELESKARYQDRLLRQAVETFQAGLMITDPQGRIVQANRHWRERLGIDDLDKAPTWPELVRQSIQSGRYVDAAGREDDFFQWRMSIVEHGESVPIRINSALTMCRDHRLPDGSIVHFSTDVSPSQRDAVTLQEVLQADLSLGLMVMDASAPTFPVIYANAGVAQMSGRDKQALPGAPALDVLAALGSGPGERERLQAALQQGHSCVAVLKRPGHGDQAPARSFELRLTPLQGEDGGAISHFMVLLHDITDQQTAAERLRVSEELYRCVAATISDGLLVVGLDGRLVAMNPAGHRILGLGKDHAQALYGSVLDLHLLQDDLSSPLPIDQLPWVQTARTGQRLRNQVYPLRTPDDELVWIQLSCHVLAISSEATPFAVVATFRDITQERAAAQALARSEERWKFALEGAGDAVWDWSVGQGIVFYSSRWRAMLGFDEENPPAEGIKWIDRIHPDERAPVAEAFEDYCHEGEGIFQAEFRIQHKSGHYIWILSRGKVVRRDADGRPLRVVGTHSDITLLKEAERAMSDKRSAELANHAKTEFLSRMSHEIRTPLNAVRGFAQLLDQNFQHELAPEVRTYVGHILHSSELLSDLVSDVLDLQQIEAGAMHLHGENLRLPALIEPCLAMFEPLAQSTGLRLSADLAYVGPAWGDRRRLAQVINNLISNAIKYNLRGGRVEVRTQSLDDQRWQLIVQDNGPGMSKEQLNKLFQPFERLGKDTSTIEGTGLGLIITKSLVEAMGGCLDINSLLGQGTRVIVTLDRKPPDQGAASASPLADEPQADVADEPVPTAEGLSPCTETAPLRVMYVEDNRINAMLFEEALRPYPQLQLEVAEDGQVAMTVAREHRPEVLVIDAHLPGMTGFEVLTALRRLPGFDSAPAYMCSADALPEDIAKAHQAGFTGYWTKPINIEQVTSELCKLARQGR
jgi:PAS domain S-box-containing protein